MPSHAHMRQRRDGGGGSLNIYFRFGRDVVHTHTLSYVIIIILSSGKIASCFYIYFVNITALLSKGVTPGAILVI